tara:strand:+ start:209 stop:535 length:327 start_codon:yes stop_codon:yes gene_type:complete
MSDENDNVVDLAAFRKQKEKEKEDEEQRLLDETKAIELAELEYLKEVLGSMVASLPPVTGGFYSHGNYLYDGIMSFNMEEDISPSDQIFFDYDSGWASDDDDDEDDEF